MKTNIRVKMSKRIRCFREKRGLTQEKLAEIARIDYKYLQKIEGKNPPNIKIETLERLAKALAITLSELLDLE